MHFVAPTAAKQRFLLDLSRVAMPHGNRMVVNDTWQTPGFKQTETKTDPKKWWTCWAAFRAVRMFIFCLHYFKALFTLCWCYVYLTWAIWNNLGTFGYSRSLLSRGFSAAFGVDQGQAEVKRKMTKWEGCSFRRNAQRERERERERQRELRPRLEAADQSCNCWTLCWWAKCCIQLYYCRLIWSAAHF